MTNLPNAEDAAISWKEIQSMKVDHRQDAEWIDKSKEKM